MKASCTQLYDCDECPNKNRCKILYKIDRDCIICGAYIYDVHTICTECRSRLKEILYSEREEDKK